MNLKSLNKCCHFSGVDSLILCMVSSNPPHYVCNICIKVLNTIYFLVGKAVPRTLCHGEGQKQRQDKKIYCKETNSKKRAR